MKLAALLRDEAVEVERREHASARHRRLAGEMLEQNLR